VHDDPTSRPVSIAVLIPCLNEEQSIAGVVREFRETLPSASIYVFDNGSTDGTAAAAREAGAIVRSEPRRGKGNVVRRMFADADADVFVMVDGDGTYDAARAPEMVSFLLERSLDMVVGTRAPDDDAGQQERAGHAFGNRAFNSAVGAIFGRHFTDIFSGYRVLSRRFVKSFPAESHGFETETELAIHAIDLRVPVAEIPTRYRPRGEDLGESKLRTFRDGARIAWTILRLFREVRPLQLFLIVALLLTIAAWAIGGIVVVEYAQTGLVARIPSAILATGFQLLAGIALAIGVIIESVSRSRREMKRLFYLQLPPPGTRRHEPR
jgi:glycosyltransferase involved in cell wall biosynthesis